MGPRSGAGPGAEGRVVVLVLRVETPMFHVEHLSLRVVEADRPGVRPACSTWNVGNLWMAAGARGGRLSDPGAPPWPLRPAGSDD
jgi:hypothetical protein